MYERCFKYKLLWQNRKQSGKRVGEAGIPGNDYLNNFYDPDDWLRNTPAISNKKFLNTRAEKPRSEDRVEQRTGLSGSSIVSIGLPDGRQPHFLLR